MTTVALWFLLGTQPLSSSTKAALWRQWCCGWSLGHRRALRALTLTRQQIPHSEHLLALDHHPVGHQIKADTPALALVSRVGGT